MKDIELQELGKYLKENDTKLKDAKDILKRALEINPNNQRSVWKARRLELYIAQRFEEYKKGLLGKKAESVRRVMEKDNYKRLAKSFNLTGRAGRAFKNFNHLITDPRQQHFFKLKNFKIKGLTEDLLKKLHNTTKKE